MARHAGVSTAVVSYVVNNGPKAVAPATAARVRAAITSLQYRPNANARALRRGTTETLGLVLPDITNPFFAELALAIEIAAAAYGHMLVVANTMADRQVERQILDDLGNRHVDGLMVCTVMAPQDFHRGTPRVRPTVLINASSPVPGLHALGPTFRSGARQAVDHLIGQHGFASVTLINGESSEAVPGPRERGWNDAFRARDLPPGPIVRTSFSRRGGYEAALEVLGWTVPVRAIFAASDQQAGGVLSAIRGAGLRCPEDVAVVSFDGTTESQFTTPPLTVVRQPVREMAEAAVAAVLSEDLGGEAFREFPTELLVRESCGCPAPTPAGVAVVA